MPASSERTVLARIARSVASAPRFTNDDPRHSDDVHRSVLVTAAVRLWNMRQGESLPRLHEELTTHSYAARLREQSRGGTSSVRIHGCVATVGAQRPAHFRDPQTGHTMVVLTLTLHSRYVA